MFEKYNMIHVDITRPITGQNDHHLSVNARESESDRAYLQGFCLMNNLKGSYTRREHYHSFLLSYTYSGEGHLNYMGKSYSVNAGNGFLIMLRVQHACILLSTSTLSVEETALQSGFENMSNFVYQIKKRTGMTPSAFRKKNR